MPTPLRYSRPMLPTIAGMSSPSVVDAARRQATPIRQQAKDLYRDPYEQGNLPIGITDPEPTPRLSYEIIGKPEMPEIDTTPPAPTPQTPTLNQDPSTLNLPDMNNPLDLSWLDNAISAVGGTLTDYFKNPMAYPAIATAYQQWKNADKYGDLAESYKKQGDPYGPYREAAAQRLEQLYADPSVIANTPGYKFRLSEGLGLLSGQMGAQHGGYGNEFRTMQNYAQNAASTEYDKEVERLMKLAGVNISPEASLSAQSRAYDQEVAARNGALQALATPFGQNEGNKAINDISKLIPAGGAAAGSIIDGLYKLANGTSISIPDLQKAVMSGDKAAAAVWDKLFPGNLRNGNFNLPPEFNIDDRNINAGPPEPPEDYGPPEPLYPDPGDGSMGPPEFDPFDPGGFDGFFDP